MSNQFEYPEAVIAKEGHKVIVNIGDKNLTITSYFPISLTKFDTEDLNKSSSLKGCFESGLLLPYNKDMKIKKHPLHGEEIPKLRDNSGDKSNIDVKKNLDGSISVVSVVPDDIITRAGEVTKKAREKLKEEQKDFGADDRESVDGKLHIKSDPLEGITLVGLDGIKHVKS